MQTESERLEKEKENLQLKESITDLKRQLMEKERELHNRSAGVCVLAVLFYYKGFLLGKRHLWSM